MAKLHPSRVILAFCFLSAFLSLAPVALAIDIEGVQPAAYDLPQVNFFLRRAPADPPLGAVGYGLPDYFNIIAYLDTGTSSILLSHETAYGMQIASSTYGRETVTFQDVGVYGAEEFDVSEQIYGAFAPTYDGVDSNNLGTYSSVYNQTFGPVRTQISRLEDPSGGLDILGMPVMAGKVVVINPQPPFSSPMIVDAGTRTSSKNVWLMSWLDSRSRGSIERPGVSIGMQNSEMPLCFLTSVLVRAASQM